MPAFRRPCGSLTVTFRYNDHRQRRGAVRSASRPDRGSDPGADADRRAEGRLPRTRLQRLCQRERRAPHLRRDDHRLSLAPGRRAGVLRRRARSLLLRQGARQRVFRLGARRQAGVHAARRPRSHRPAPRLPALDDARRRDPCSRGGDRHHAGSTRTSRSSSISHRIGRSLRTRSGKSSQRHGLTEHVKVDRARRLSALHNARPGAEALAGIPHAVPAGDHPARRADALARRRLFAWQ